MVVGAVLCFYRLGSRAMWQDEGETAVLARSVLMHGIPLAKVGKNLVQQDARAFDDSYRWTFHPWGQFYLAAAGLKVVGENTLGARTPFALCGVLCVGLVFVVVWRATGCASSAIVCSLLLALSATFVTHSRQCRYYALDAFTCTVVVAMMLELLRRPTGTRAGVFGLALAAQFYTNFGMLWAIVPGLVFIAWLHRASLLHVKFLGVGAAVATVLAIPGVMIHGRRLIGGDGVPSPVPLAGRIIAHLSYIDGWFAPLVVLVIAGGVLIIRVARNRTEMSAEARLAVGCAVLVLAGAIIMAVAAPLPHVRYLLALMPVAKIVLGVCLVGSVRFVRELTQRAVAAWAFGVLAFVVLVATNMAATPVQFIADLPDQRTPDFCTATRPYLRFELSGLLHELTSDFPCFDRARLDAVHQFAEQGDLVLMNYGDLPLVFHRPDLVIRGGADGSDRPVEIGRKPDLILLQSKFRLAFRGYVDELLATGDYEERRETVPNAPFGNIPEPRAHFFAAPTDTADLWVFVRKKTPAASK